MLQVPEVADTSAPLTLTKAEAEERRRMKEWLDGKIAAGKKHPISEIVTLTPVLAQLILERNPINRPINKRNASDLVQDVANKRFVFNGESIIISDTGVLNDGQHRCQTVVETKIPIPVVIVFGPKEETRFTVDTGKSKTVSNFLAMKGRMYTHTLGAASGYFLQWSKTGVVSINGLDRPSKQAILIAADEIKGIDKSVEFTVHCMKSIRSHAVLAFCHNVFWKRSGRDAADEFIGKLIDGDGLRKGTPLWYCRERLNGMPRGTTAQTRIELIFKCWNAWRRGEGITHLKLSGNLPKVEK